MSLKVKIEARLKAKAAGVNLSKERIEAIVARAEKGLTDESDDTQIDAQLSIIDELTPFKELAALDDHKRAKAKKDAEDKAKSDKEAAEKAAKEGKIELPEDAPAWMKAFLEAQSAQTKALTDQIAAISTEKVTNTRRDQFITSMKGTSEDYQKRELKRFDRMKFEKEEDFNAFLEETKDDHTAAVQEEADKGSNNSRPAGGTGGSIVDNKKEATEAEVDAAFANLKI